MAQTAGIHPEEYAAALTPIQQKALIGALKKWTIGIADYAPFTEAIVTAGGVSVDEIDPSTMQSKLVKGLYFAAKYSISMQTPAVITFKSPIRPDIWPES